MGRKIAAFLILWALPAFAQQQPEPFYDGLSPRILQLEPTYMIVIRDAKGMLVGIKPDGTLEYGKNYAPAAAAKLFWEAMAIEARKVCK